MARGLSDVFYLSDDDEHFQSLRRMFDENERPVRNRILPFPAWVKRYCDYSHTKHTQTGIHDLSNTDLDIQRKMGVLINMVFPVDGKHPNQLAQYCAFKSLKELSSYVDVIVPDIVWQAAFVAHDYFCRAMCGASQAEQDFQKLIQPLYKECYNNRTQHIRTLAIEIDLVVPLRVLITYHSNEKVREFIDNVAKLCTKPAFIPVLNQTVSTPGLPTNISPCAFILAHAVQILLFAPQDWDPDRVYTRDLDAYAHRFPTPETIGGGTTPVIAGLFSMEDLYRAILLFYHLLKRRTATKWITKTAPTSSSNAEFPGYHQPTSPSVDEGAHQDIDEPRLSENSPSASKGAPQANEVDAVVVNNEPDDSGNDEDRSDQPEEDANEPEGVLEDENADENESEAHQSREGNGEANQGDEEGNENEQANEDEGADMPERFNETETIEGLKTITINTLILETLTTTRPSECLSQRLRDLGKPPISSDDIGEELWFLLEHHLMPDFGSEVSACTKNDTQVPFDLGPSDMKHLIKGPSGNSEINQPSPLVLVEECRYQWDIPHYPEIDDLGHAQPPGQGNHPMSESLEHRKAVLTSFDWRNKILLELEEPPFLATVDNARSAMKDLLNPEIEEFQIAGFGTEEVTPLVNTYKLLRDDQTCGLRLLFDQAIGQRSRHAPTTRLDCIRWVCYYNPIMTRALEVANKHCGDDKERLVVYVEDSWIQCIVVALFVVAGFNVGSIRSSDTAEEQANIIEHWKNKTSGLEILVANLDTKAMDINVHTDCTKGLLLNWTLEPERMLKIVNNMGSTGQKERSVLHMVKVAGSYHDVIERVCCTNWAMQLSKDIKLPEWMTGVIREICIFELIKSTWHQEFNRYACVVAHDLKGRDFEYHDPKWGQLGHVFSIVAKLVLHHPEDKEFWVESMSILVELCFHFNDAFDVSGFLGTRLCLTPKEMRKSFFPMFKGIKSARAAIDDEQASERRETLQRGLEARAGDRETVTHRGEKRKAGDDGEDGMKKQKTSAT
ncbi:hypothetical protein FPANT_9825 [Fusarium pseudoanthophilum]|uniref:Uncharacterized protein n=1 Tax=Fusarium pseudoanthophilum TaxID=48495 RepID=A0A8H5KTH3_9HYPO|nr:hypothetical protein FPANT_9825 [Fusarium pseudoanthophilum]